VLRRGVIGALMLLAAAHAISGGARAQPNAAPAPVPAALDAAAAPLTTDAANLQAKPRRVIASSQAGPARPVGTLSVPDDGLTPNLGAAPARAASASGSGVRTAIYRPDLDAGSVVPVGTNGASTGAPIALSDASLTGGARLDVHVFGPTEVALGKPFVYEINVESSGNVPAAAVRVSDRLPTGARLLNAEPRPEIAGDRITWDLGDMPPATARRLRVTIDADRLTSALLVSPTASFGVAPGLRAAPARQGLELRLTGPETAPPGVVVPFRVQIVNNGGSALTRAVVLVKLPPGLRHPQVGNNNDAIEADVALAAGETKTLPLDLVAGGTGANVVNASARADGLSAEASATVYVDRAAPAAMVAPRSATPLRVEINNLSQGLTVGGTAVYEVRLLNPDDAPQTGIRLIGYLSDGLEPEQADGPTASVQAPHGVVFETLRRLAAGESVVYHVRARSKRAGVQQLKVEVNADRLPQPVAAELSTWVAPGHGR
jgi:uncharacterized repeat protein (TIGR01451 family)